MLKMQRDCQETLGGYLKGSRGNEMEARSNLGINSPICIYYLHPPPCLCFGHFLDPETFFRLSDIQDCFHI